MLGYPKGWMDHPTTTRCRSASKRALDSSPYLAGRRLTPASHSREIVETVNIRRFDNPASLGAGIERHETDMLVGHMTVNANWVRQNLPSITSPRNLEIMVGFGDSMAPTINDGDLVLVDRGIREVRIDAIYVFTLANELFIKTLQRIPGDGIRVISDNKKYDPYVLDSSSRKEMEILARVCWAWNGRKL
jgi:phage repressor protein C with HTH and peptisase S24 domain